MKGLVASTTGLTGDQKCLRVLELRCAGKTATRVMNLQSPAPGNIGCTHHLAKDPTEAEDHRQGTQSKLSVARCAWSSLASHSD